MSFLLIFGPRESSKTLFLAERYCNFARITLFIPRGAPRVFLDELLSFFVMFAVFKGQHYQEIDGNVMQQGKD